MKKILFAILSGSALLVACNPQNDTNLADDSKILSLTTVPLTIQNALLTSYPTATQVNWTQISPSTFQAQFTVHDTVKLADFNTKGKCTASRNVIDAATLPAAVTDYLTANYSGYTIVKAGAAKDKDGAITNYVVLITVGGTSYALEFDASGNFLKIVTKDGHFAGNAITQSNLPDSIKTYLESNYAGYTFIGAEVRLENSIVSGYAVAILYNSQPLLLFFDANAKFIAIKTGHTKPSGQRPKEISIAQTELPAVITSYLSANYSGYTFVSAEVAKDSSGNILRYEVKFTWSSKKYQADFDGAGALLSVH
jgi:hypothetical protein